MIFRLFEGRSSASAASVLPSQTSAHLPDSEAIKQNAASVTLLSPISKWIEELYRAKKDLQDGSLPTYIPELQKANPSHFGIALTTGDGHTYASGECDIPFTIQSISKPLIYGLALQDHGVDEVLRRVGVEPTGEAFNSIIMDEVNNRPFNPMVNAGAIATTALVKGDNAEERLARILATVSGYAGRDLSIDEAVYRSEKATGHRNRAIAYLQLNSGMISEPVDVHLDLYFKQCSILVTARDLAVIAATLANDGVNPLTGVRVLASDYVKAVLSIMSSCGMYDYSGEWLYRVGLPAKSGVAGGVIAVLPGQFGFGVYSPLLDARGNSHRGIEVCKELAGRLYLHLFDAHPSPEYIIRRSYRGGAMTSKRLRCARERAILEKNGTQIVVYELQGDLYFATAEQLLRKIGLDAADAKFIVLDGKRLTKGSRTALLLLQDLARDLTQSGRTLLLAGFSDQVLADWLVLREGQSEIASIFPTADIALENCENNVISSLDPAALETSQSLPLSEIDILRTLTPEEIRRLEPFLQKAKYAPGQQIIKEGDEGDRLFMITAGSATVSTFLEDGKRSARLAAYRPGVAFGEFALFDGGRRRGADVVADTDVTSYVLTFERLAELERSEPDLYKQILLVLGRLLTDRLRRVTADLRALS